MKLYVLVFTWYRGMDGGGSSIFGVFSSMEEAEKAQARYLENNTLADEEYNLEFLHIEEYTLDKDAWEE